MATQWSWCKRTPLSYIKFPYFWRLFIEPALTYGGLRLTRSKKWFMRGEPDTVNGVPLLSCTAVHSRKDNHGRTAGSYWLLCFNIINRALGDTACNDLNHETSRRGDVSITSNTLVTWRQWNFELQLLPLENVVKHKCSFGCAIFTWHGLWDILKGA